MRVVLSHTAPITTTTTTTTNKQTTKSAPWGDRLEESANSGTNSRSGRLGREAESERGSCREGLCIASAKPPIGWTSKTSLRRQLDQR